MKKQKTGTDVPAAASSLSKPQRGAALKNKRKRRNLDKILDRICSLICRTLARGICESCGKAGTQTHHYFSKKAFPHLRFTINNLIWLCFFCHIRRIHQQSQYELARDTLIRRIGKKSFNCLKKKAYMIYDTVKPKVDKSSLEPKLNAILNKMRGSMDTTVAHEQSEPRQRSD